MVECQRHHVPHLPVPKRDTFPEGRDRVSRWCEVVADRHAASRSMYNALSSPRALNLPSCHTNIQFNMSRLPFFCLVAALGLAAADGMYSSKSPVLQVNAKNYDSLIAQSNHTSVSPVPQQPGSALISADRRILCTMVWSLSESQTRLRESSQEPRRSCQSGSCQLRWRIEQTPLWSIWCARISYLEACPTRKEARKAYDWRLSRSSRSQSYRGSC